MLYVAVGTALAVASCAAATLAAAYAVSHRPEIATNTLALGAISLIGALLCALIVGSA